MSQRGELITKLLNLLCDPYCHLCLLFTLVCLYVVIICNKEYVETSQSKTKSTNEQIMSRDDLDKNKHDFLAWGKTITHSSVLQIHKELKK